MLVGGEGTRLRPLTWRTPKSLVPVLNRPFLEHAFAHLTRHGIDEVVLAVARNDLAERIRQVAGDGSAYGLRLHYSVEDEALGSAGAFKLAEHFIKDETFVGLNGDILTDLDLSAMIEQHSALNSTVTISLLQVEDPSAFGVVAMDDDARITRFVEKPKREDAPSNWINAGAWIIERRALDRVPPHTFVMVEHTLFPELIEAGEPVHGFKSDPFWVDIGVPERYLSLNLSMARRSAGEGDTVVTGAGTAFGAGSKTAGTVVTGERCIIGDGATIRDSLLWDDVKVGDRARIEGSILATGSSVCAGAVLVDAVIGHEAQVLEPNPPNGLKLGPEERWPA